MLIPNKEIAALRKKYKQAREAAMGDDDDDDEDDEEGSSPTKRQEINRVPKEGTNKT